ncbi:MAG TPA: hypothetical protein VMT29_02245 [Steroidobacteraceae bacterium]|nr:hypothetical protein [Steroidobacteraceae bacterium]
MADFKHRSEPGAAPDATPSGPRRRMSRIVHDHKGNASVQWHDAPDDYERPKLEIETTPAAGAQRGLDIGSLALRNEDTHNPYMRVPDPDRQASGRTTRTDLRRLSAWIKMMRELEEAKKRNGGEEGGDES